MKKFNQLILHIAFWIIFNVLQYVRYITLNYVDLSSAFYLLIGVQILLNLITFYGIYFIVFTKFFKSSELKAIILFIVFILTNVYLRVYISRFVFLAIEKETWLDKYNSFGLQTIFVFTYSGLAFLVRFTIHWFHDQQIKAELINQKQTSELALLRAQVNPHFLFNTLNNIYSLAIQKSENVAESIARLSGIMRYMLSDSDTKKVPLKKEIEYLQNFIELQRLRTEFSDAIQFEVKGEVSGKEIAPMLLIPFIENAFKHGSKKVSSPAISIIIAMEKQFLKLMVLNFIKEKKNDINSSPKGTGLDNVQKRLKLLYKNKYHMMINEDTNKKQFEVNLSIEL